MKTLRKERFATIETTDAERFSVQVNDLLEKLAGREYSFELKMNTSGHCAYFRWTEKETICENVRDRYLERGEEYVCGECPHFVPPTEDGRKVRGSCCYKRTVDRRAPACLTFYEELATGEINLEVER